MDNIYLLIFYSILAIFMLITFFLILYIRNQNMVWSERKKFQESEMSQQKQLLSAVIESQEIERKRIGEDLHDEVGGTLSAVKLMLNAALKQYSKADKEMILPAKQLIDKMVVDVRNLAHDLSPPGLTMFGLYTSIESFVSLINETGEIEIVMSNENLNRKNLVDEKSELALFRIITQLIANTIKHAQASQIEIKFQSDDLQLNISYFDNGQGFNIETLDDKKGIGMQNIKSRLQMINATYQIETSLNNGFMIDIYCPMIKD